MHLETFKRLHSSMIFKFKNDYVYLNVVNFIKIIKMIINIFNYNVIIEFKK